MQYSNDIITFDTEVTTVYKYKGEWRRYSPYIPEDADKMGFCYAWMLSYISADDSSRSVQTILKRTMTDLAATLYKISLSNPDVIFTVWVHNLGYDFEVLRNVIKFDKIFAKNPHQIIYADWRNIRFRCSYMLTHQSLENLGESYKLDITKKTSDGYRYNYLKVRTPLTRLNDDEYDYCVRDTITLAKGIDIYLNRYGCISNIPLTQTGAVRQRLKKTVHDDMRYKRLMARLIPKTVGMYALFNAVKWGGYTHANFLYVDRVLVNVDSWDISSSYPFQQISKKFPMEQFALNPTHDKINDTVWKESHSFIVFAEFSNYESATYNTYVSSSHCLDLEDAIIDNGRVLKAKRFKIYLTDADYSIIIDSMTADTIVNIIQMWSARKDYLPLPVVYMLLDLYGNKTGKKEVDNNLYMRSKEELNSVYGMMLSALAHALIELDDGASSGWRVKNPTELEIQDRLSYLSNNPNKCYYSFAWGLWTVAYARRQIWDMIIAQDEYNAYSDTDSSKLTEGYDKDFVLNYNDNLVRELDALMTARGINPERTRPRKKDGTPVQIGIFDYEGRYSEFKTLGAKRYVYRKSSNGKLYMTVSGVSKKYGARALNDDINNFKEDMVIEYEDCRRLVMQYRNNQPNDIVHGWTNDQRYGVSSTPSTYTMSLEPLFKDLVRAAMEHSYNMPDNAVELHRLIEEGFNRDKKN